MAGTRGLPWMLAFASMTLDLRRAFSVQKLSSITSA
jgi:hypothetical protein